MILQVPCCSHHVPEYHVPRVVLVAAMWIAKFWTEVASTPCHSVARRLCIGSIPIPWTHQIIGSKLLRIRGALSSSWRPVPPVDFKALRIVLRCSCHQATRTKRLRRWKCKGLAAPKKRHNSDNNYSSYISYVYIYIERYIAMFPPQLGRKSVYRHCRDLIHLLLHVASFLRPSHWSLRDQEDLVTEKKKAGRVGYICWIFTGYLWIGIFFRIFFRIGSYLWNIYGLFCGICVK